MTHQTAGAIDAPGGDPEDPASEREVREPTGLVPGEITTGPYPAVGEMITRQPGCYRAPRIPAR